MANAPGRYESTVTGEPHLPSPMSAWRRATSVETSSGAGSARVSSDSWTMRPGVGSMASGDRVDAGWRGVRFEIQQQQRAQHFRIAHRRRQLQAAQVQVARHEAQAQVQGGRAAIAVLEALAQRIEQPREDERERLEFRDGPFQLERRLERLLFEPRARAAPCLRRAPGAASGCRPAPAAPRDRRTAARPVRPACAGPSGR